MTLTLELTPEQERRIAGAREKGIPVESLLLAVIDRLPVADTLATLHTLEAQQDAEDAKHSPEQITQENEAWEAFLAQHPLHTIQLRIPPQ